MADPIDPRERDPGAEPGQSGPEASGPHDSARGIAAERSARLAKLAELRSSGVDPYPHRYDRTHTLDELRRDFGHLEAGVETDDVVRVAGRVLLIRRQGKIIFATMRDRSGSIQLLASRAVLGDGEFDRFDGLDLGDWVGIEGVVIVTRRGELSVKVSRLDLLAKALRPLPDKWRGLTDTDTRFRQRYADLIVNDEARRVFEVRHAVVTSIRRTLDRHSYIEVETPVLQLEVGGAHARPFRTHHHALDMPLFLRIALELHLKRLIVGGLERVYEIGRVFRNEGISTRHNPEFTMLESYQAFADYGDIMALTEELIVHAAIDALGTTTVEIAGATVDLSVPWRKASMLDLIEEFAGVRVHPSLDVDALRAILDARGLAYAPHMGPGKLCVELYDELVEPHLIAPTFVTEHPLEVSPLAKTHRRDPYLVERFELVVAGRELANGYSELNDPVVQRERFEQEVAARAAGDTEAASLDEDYLRALEYGLPPTGGLGVGVDRLTMLLAGVGSIREVILFPTLRPEAP